MKRKAAEAGLRSVLRRAAKKAKVAKSVKQYVKKAINKEIETKDYRWNPAQQSMIHANNGLGLYVCNLTYGLSRGTGPANYIGDKIHLKGISFKYSLENYLNKDAYFNYAIVASDAEISDLLTQDFNAQAVPDSAEFIENGTTQSANWRLATENIRVLKRGTKRLRRQFNDNKTFERGTVYKKMNKRVAFDSSGYLRDKNYYVIVWLSICGAEVNESVLLYSDIKIYFKDA
jgi:hypothetical protein